MLDLILALSGSPGTIWNPNDKSAATVLSNSNLTATLTAVSAAVRATNAGGGKVAFEVTVNATGNMFVGIGSKAWVFSTLTGYSDTNGAMYWTGGSIGANAQALVSASTYTTGDVITVAVDIPNHLVYFAKNGVWQNSADPAAGTGGIDYITTAPVYPALQYNDNPTTIGQFTARFNLPFVQPIPTGFSAWG